MIRSGAQPGTAARASAPLSQLITTNSEFETERELDHVAHQRIVIDMQNTERFHACTHVSAAIRAQSSHGNHYFFVAATNVQKRRPAYHGVARGRAP